MKALTRILIKVCCICSLIYFNAILPLDTSSVESTLHEHVESTIEDFKLRLHNTLEDNRIRRTRSTFGQDETEVYNAYISELESFEEIPSVAVWCLVTVNNSEVVFAVTYNGSISVLYDFEFISLYEFSTKEPITSLLGFQHDNRLWLVALHLEKQNRQYLQVYEYDSNTAIYSRQHINLHGDTLISIVTVEKMPYLVLVTNKELKKDSNLVLFVWTETKFDEILMFSLHSKCKYLVAWQIRRVLFFAASLYDKSQLTIWQYAKPLGKFIPVQVLEGNFHVVKHFQYSGSDYLVCGTENKVIIFWWSGASFLKQQEFYSSDSDYIVDISTMMLFQEAVIISVKTNQLEYFFQDSSASYTRAGSITLDSLALKSSTIWKSEDGKLFLLPVFQDPHPARIMELELNLTLAPPFLDNLNLHKCSEDLYETIREKKERISKLHSKIDKVWRKDKSMLVSASLNIQESLISYMAAYVTNIFFIKSHVTLNIPAIFSMYDKLKERIPSLLFEIQNSVWKSEDEIITGDINLMKSMQAQEANFGELSELAKINEVKTSTFPSLLKVVGSQVFQDNFSLGNASAKFVSSIILNDIPVKDYLLLEDQETISGNLIFQDLAVNHMTVTNNTINDLELSNIVISSGEQNLEDKKLFSSLLCKSLSSIYEIAGINSSDLEKIVLNYAPELGVKLNFTSPIIIGNITLNTLNGLNLMNLILNSLKIFGSESIRGEKYFSHPLNIKELSVLGKMNELNLTHLMTLHTSQNVPTDIKFRNVSFNDIETHFVNGIDLCSDAVLKTGDEVNGIVKFIEPLTVSSINMKDGVCINSVDISNYASIFFSQTLYYNDTVVLGSISVLNDVQIEGEDISSLINKLQTDVWLKRTNQIIPEGNFKLLLAKDVNAQIVNGYALDNLALNDGNVTFNNVKNFKDIYVKSLAIQDGKTLNNALITPNMISAAEEILSNLEVENMTIKGDLITYAINDIALHNLMQGQRMQICKGMYAFDKIYLDYLESDYLSLNTFYNRNFDSYVQASVSVFSDKKIRHKNFMQLIGKDMVTQGFLNGKKFEEMFKYVVTLSTDQIISHVHLGEIKTKGLFVENFAVTDLSQVVSKFTPGYIASSKLFSGNVTVKDMQLNGELEKVDVKALQKYAFFKGMNNSVSYPMIFLADLKANTIQVPLYSTIDGIELNNLIQMNKNFYSKSMHFSSINLTDVEIDGEINGCDLKDIAKLISLKSKGHIKVVAVKNLTQLKVDGNLSIGSDVNQVSGEKFTKAFSNFDLNVSDKRDFYFSSIKAAYLQTVDVNEVNVNFLMTDAVKQRNPEIIRGNKHFKKQVASRNLTIDVLKVTFLCELNIPHLYNRYVSKQKEQKITIKRLHQVKARNVTIGGTLNKLKLPNDVILANTDDYIPSFIVNSSVEMYYDLNINGAIDGIELKNLVENRVTLSNSEMVMSTLIFFNDIFITDRFVVRGLVNAIKLSNAVKTIGENIINGPKTLQRNLVLQSDLLASSSINDISELHSLFINVCLKDEESNITDMVNFTGIETSHLIVERINNISLDNLWDAIYSAETNFEEKITTSSNMNLYKKDNLLKIGKEILETSPFYGFFELHQTLRYPTTQFLPIYESGISGEDHEVPVYKMVVWVNLNKTCKRYKSRIMDVNPNGILTNQKTVQGRLFPLVLYGDEDIELFILHADKNKSCINAGNVSLEVVYKNGNRQKINLHQHANSTLLQARLLRSDNNIFILMAFTFLNGNGPRMFLYKYNRNFGNLVLLKEFHEFDVSSFDVILSIAPHQVIHLAVANAGNHPGIHYYLWNSDYTFVHHSFYPKSVSTAVMFISVNEDIFLLLAKEKTIVKKEYDQVFVYTEPIEVHGLTENEFPLLYAISIKGISSFEKFIFEEETYVLAVSHHFQVIHILQYRGYNGFEVIQKIDAPGVVVATVFSSTQFDTLLAISSITGHTRILKFVARGIQTVNDIHFELY